MIAERLYLSELLFEDYQIEISGLLRLRHNFQKFMKDLILRHWPCPLTNLSDKRICKFCQGQGLNLQNY